MTHKLPTPHVGKRNKQFDALRSKLISLAGLIGHDVVNQDGEYLGLVVDLVFRWDTSEPYPPLTGIIARVSRRNVWVTAHKIARITSTKVELATAKLDLREFKPREGEVRLAKEVMDHQLIDVDGVRVVRASDLYVATVAGQIRLVGVDVSLRSLLRRLGPRSLRTRPTPDLVIDWASIQSFGGQETAKHNLKLTAHRNELRRLRPGELADLLEDLSRDERQELLNSLPKEQAADALEEMEPKEVETILRETSKSEAGKYLSKMEPDEAADALRDIDENLRNELLKNMTQESARRVQKVLSYDEATAGGFMNSSLFRVSVSETAADVRKKLLAQGTDPKEIESVVVEEGNKLVYDLALVDVLLADPKAKIGDLIKPPETVIAPPTASIEEVASLLVDSRRVSVLVVDENGRAIGRIFADDIVDALMPETGRFHFPRILS